MDRRIFNRFRKIVLECSGIRLGERKEALVSARVGKRMRELGITDHGAYLKCIDEDTTGQEKVKLLDAISTNVTSFFREARHFEFLSRALDEWLAQGDRRFRFWSAASSTGEEPYSMAMTILASLGGRFADVRILATDISTKVLEHCAKGVYEKNKIDLVPQAFRNRYFERHGRIGNVQYAVKPALRDMLVFKRLNLAEMPFVMKGPFDAIFCRNVMIYLDQDIRVRLLGELYRLLRPGGYLFVGHAESLTGLVSDFAAVEPAVYIKA